MPINCDEDSCPLTSANPLPKFCPDCGAASASKVVPLPACRQCGLPWGDTTPKFCPECGTATASRAPEPKPAAPASPPPSPKAEAKAKAEAVFEHYGYERPTGPVEPGTKVYGDVSDLLRRHEEARARVSTPTTGRGLTAEEVERMTSNARKGRTADRTYSESSRDLRYSERPADAQDVEDYKKVSGLTHFADDEESRQHAGIVSRRGVQGQGGAEKAGRYGSKGIGALAGPDAKLDPDYHEHVRVLPYRFSTPTHSGRQVLGTGQPPEDKGGQLTPEEAAFYSSDQLDAAAASRLLKADPDDE